MRSSWLGFFVLAACSASESDGAAPSASASRDAPSAEAPATATGTDTPPGAVAPAKTTVAMFVAIGHEGRTTISCDDGKTWVANRSDDDTVRCFEGLDCDHDGRAGRGVAFAQGTFVANFGWGAPGTIRRSRDGVTWETVGSGANYASMVYGGTTLVAISNSPRVSNDVGTTWVKPTVMPPSSGTPRRGGFGGTGTFLRIGDGPKASASRDRNTWASVPSLPETCGLDMQWSGGIGGVGALLVVVGGDGTACTSPDDGATWTSTPFAKRVTGRLVRHGDALYVWGETAEGVLARFRSVDGTTWTSAPLTLRSARPGAPAAPSIGPVAAAPSGTFVAANAGWQQYYEKQRFYRSADGIAWEELPAGAFTPSHPMTHMAWGEAAPSSACPLAP